MKFDAGQYGIIEADRIVDKGDRIVASVGTGYDLVTYVRWKRGGGVSSACFTPPADMSPETRAKVKRDIARCALAQFDRDPGLLDRIEAMQGSEYG